MGSWNKYQVLSVGARLLGRPSCLPNTHSQIGFVFSEWELVCSMELGCPQARWKTSITFRIDIPNGICLYLYINHLNETEVWKSSDSMMSSCLHSASRCAMQHWWRRLLPFTTEATATVLRQNSADACSQTWNDSSHKFGSNGQKEGGEKQKSEPEVPPVDMVCTKTLWEKTLRARRQDNRQVIPLSKFPRTKLHAHAVMCSCMGCSRQISPNQCWKGI